MAKEISRDFPESKSNVVNAVNKTMVSFELTIPPPPLNPHPHPAPKNDMIRYQTGNNYSRVN